MTVSQTDDTLPSTIDGDDIPIAFDADAVFRNGMEPNLTGSVPVDSAREFDLDETRAFFERVAEDYGPWEVGLALGWSPAMIRRFLADPERQAILEALKERDLDSVERAVKTEARSGNMVAAKMVLYSHGAHRGWSDTRHVKVDTREQQEIVISVRAGLDEATRELVEAHGEDGVAALQQAYLDDVIDADVVE